MRRVLPSLLVASLFSLVVVSSVSAAKPATTCPSQDSGYFMVDLEEWWSITVDRFELAGITVYEADGVTYTAAFDEFAAAAGFGDGAGLEDFVRVAQWEAMNHNGNDWVCMKYRPITPGNPAYFVNGVDDQSSSPQGGATA